MRSAKALTLVALLTCPVVGCGDAADNTPADASVALNDAEPDAAPFVCPTFSEPAQVGALTDEDLDEVSGIVESTTHPGTFWVHEDSGAGPKVYAINSAGALLTTVTLDGAVAVDWEDMAIGPVMGESGDFLFLADIGDNDEERDHVYVYRVAEPVALTDPSLHVTAARTELTYPDGAHNAEAFFVDPRDGNAYIIVKDLAGADRRIYRWTTNPLSTLSADLAWVGEVTFGPAAQPARIITGASMCRDAKTLLLRAYGQVWAYFIAENVAVADALAASPCGIAGPVESQGEAIACAPNEQRFTTVSEGAGSALWSVTW